MLPTVGVLIEAIYAGVFLAICVHNLRLSTPADAPSVPNSQPVSNLPSEAPQGVTNRTPQGVTHRTA